MSKINNDMRLRERHKHWVQDGKGTRKVKYEPDNFHWTHFLTLLQKAVPSFHTHDCSNVAVTNKGSQATCINNILILLCMSNDVGTTPCSAKQVVLQQTCNMECLQIAAASLESG